MTLFGTGASHGWPLGSEGRSPRDSKSPEQKGKKGSSWVIFFGNFLSSRKAGRVGLSQVGAVSFE